MGRGRDGVNCGVDGVKWWKDLPIPGKLGEHDQIPGHIPTSQQAR